MRLRLLVFALIVTACGSSPLQPTPVQISYRVSGSTNRAFVTYVVAGGGVQQEEVPVPWMAVRYAKTGDYLSLVAQNRTEDGCVTAAIWSSTSAVREATSCGSFVVATVSAFW